MSKIKPVLEKIKHYLMLLNEKPIGGTLVVTFIVEMIVEMLSRRSVTEAFLFIVKEPVAFLINLLIIWITISISMLFKRRLFAITLTSFFWVFFGTINYIVLSSRVTPFSAVDLKLLKSVFSIIKMYLNTVEIVLIAVAAALFVVGAVYLFVRVPKVEGKIPRLKYVGVIAFIVLLTVGVNYGAIHTDILAVDVGNISFAYDQCGFVYCFYSSLVDVGIDRPLGYSEEAVEEVKDTLVSQERTSYRTRPNIIMIQLESFYDVNYMKDYTYSENPCPNFSYLKENYSHGFLTVPSIGAGTANTEFEIISGMSLDYFGFCEYPYKTILKDNVCESICYNLDELGYTSTAIHNNRGTFYSRNKVFGKLGFDNYISVEYMNDLEYNPIDWAKDEVLVDEIVKAMDSTIGKDFVYTITVQSHGKYPETVIDDTQTITMEGAPDEETKIAYEYYINQIKEVDDFIGALIAELSEYDEQVVVIMYGDHLPTFGITDDDLINDSIYQTEYVMWDNFGLAREYKDLSSYQLSAYVMERLGFDNGVLTKYHQMYQDSPDYQKNLELLQYDMLYGEKYVYDGRQPFDAKTVHMGVEDITIDTVKQGYNYIAVYGENFTEASTVYLNGNKKETVFWKEDCILVYDEELEEGDRIRVKQIASTGASLGKTDEYIYITHVDEEYADYEDINE